uniref:C3H1-type domain-containing protein n=1 Tax=Caenorhabditis tropicalis TaxID=1561998 RepID=A0A1I7U626_9PELO
MSPTNPDQLNDLLTQTRDLMAFNEQLRKEIAENEQIHSMQIQALSSIPPSNHVSSHLMADPRRRGERRMQKPESYKTVICQAWLESKTCTFAENCRFAHGEEELRPSLIEPRQNNKYKTKLCDKYTTTGLCPYGKRCLFIHPDHGPNAYIRADKLFEVSQRHALADLRDQMEQHIMTGGRTNAPSLTSVPQPLDMLGRPSTPDEPAAKMPLGPTPVSTRGPKYDVPQRNVTDEDVGNRPPSSWPLEPSSFFSIDNPSMLSRPVSPLESMLIGAAATAGVLPFTMIGKQQSTPGGVSGYSSSGSTPYQDLDPSPLTAAAAAAYFANSVAAQSLIPKSAIDSKMKSQRDESFSGMHGFDQLAEDMAKHLELW